MLKLLKVSLHILMIAVLLISAGCTASAKPLTTSTRAVPVHRGNLDVTVSVDGNLVMPETSSLAFGAAGNVKDVLVQEGDHVKAGAIMATLEGTTQMLDIKSANIAVQNTLSNLYEKVPRLPQFRASYWVKAPFPADFVPDIIIYDKSGNAVMATPMGIHNEPVYPGYYPNATSLNSFNWAASEIYNSYYYFLSENYTSASSELNIAWADLEATAKIIEDTIENPESGLGNTAPFINDENEWAFLIQQNQSFAGYYVQALRRLVADIRQGQAEAASARDLIAQEKYSEAAPLYNAMLTRMNDVGKSIITNYNVIKVRNDTKIYGEDICLYFYGAADEKLNAALKGIETGDLNSQELADNLRIAQHYMELCNGILGTNDYVLQHGLSLKAEQQYKIDLAKAVVDLGNKRDDFLKTVIMAPFDGVVVSVGVKKNDVLSAMDYSAKTIQIVDTTQVKFTGTVDEIDILKIKTGQKATVSIDAISGKAFPGHVSFISPYGASTGNVVKFNLTVMLDPTDVDLKGGLTASADVAISTVEDALMVPISAVTTSAGGSFVTVQDSATGKQEKKKVTTGIQNTQYIQIVSGLNEGDKVIVEDRATGAPVSTTMGPPGGGGGPPPGR